MKASNVPELPILTWLSKQEKWECRYVREFPNSIFHAVDEKFPEKVVIAKLRSMRKRRLIEGCFCGCRGDIEITEKGRQLLMQTL